MASRKHLKTLLLAIAAFVATTCTAQISTDTKDYQTARKRLYIGTDTAGYYTVISQVISAASTHKHSTTAKAVFDYVTAQQVNLIAGSGINITGTYPNKTIINTGDLSNTNELQTLSTNPNLLSISAGNSVTVDTDPADDVTTDMNLGQDLAGNLPDGEVVGIRTNPVNAGIPANAQSVLRWTGSAWQPDGINMYQVVTTSQAVPASINQVWVDALSASITLNLPACNAANNSVKIEVAKSGGDNYPIVIEPAGSEQFSDGQTSKTLYSQGTSISCTCNWTGSVGFWRFINM